MRVLHVIPSLSPLRGGPTAVALNLVRELRSQGVDAEICTTNDHGPNTLAVPLGERCDYEGVPVWFFPRFSLPLQQLSLGRDRSFLFSLAWTRWLWDHVRDYDVLDTHYLFAYGSTAATAIARWHQVPYTMRTMGQLAPWALAQSAKKKRVYGDLIERRSLNRAALVHCTTAGEAADVTAFGVTSPTAVVPLGVTPGAKIPQAGQALRQRYSIGADVPIILFLSRLHYKKRPELLLTALANLDSPFHLLLAGESHSPAYQQALEIQIQQWGLGERVTFTGLVTGEEKERVLQGADLFVLPSFAENFAIAVAEAMAASLPVIVTPDVQIAPEIAQAQAGLVVEGAPQPLATAMGQLLQNAPLRQQLGKNGAALARSRYYWPAIVTQLIDLYQGVVEQARHAAHPSRHR